jgi:hypothetical protein
MPIDFSDRLEILKLEMQLLQQRLAKYDELIWTVRGWAVTLTVALTSWAGTKLDEPAAMVWVLRTAAIVPALFWIEEGMLRAAYVAKYIDRYRLVRSALNASPPDLELLPLYDLTSHYAGLTPRLPRLFRSFFRLESTFLYLVLTALPLLFMLYLHVDSTQSKTATKSRCYKVEEISFPLGFGGGSGPSGDPGNLAAYYRPLARANEAWRCS